MDTQDTSSKTIALIATGLVVVGAILMFVFNSGDNDDVAPAEVRKQVPPATEPKPAVETPGAPVGQPVPTETLPSVPTKSGYIDGVYNAIGKYKTPAGPDEIAVAITLEDGVITAATVTGDSPNPVSSKFIKQFIAGYKVQVVGKNIDAVNLTTVSGSSLTPFGFKAALDQVKKDAKS
jgi:hypothetical protein